MSHITVLFLIVVMALLNLLLSDCDKALWATLVGTGFGYLIPDPALKKCEHESIHYRCQATAQWTFTRTTRPRNSQ